MEKETKKQEGELVAYKRLFILSLILIIITSFLCIIFYAESSYNKEKYEASKDACVELNKATMYAVESCLDHCNITDANFQQIYKDYLIKKYMNKTDEREVENNE